MAKSNNKGALLAFCAQQKIPEPSWHTFQDKDTIAHPWKSVCHIEVPSNRINWESQHKMTRTMINKYVKRGEEKTGESESVSRIKAESSSAKKKEAENIASKQVLDVLERVLKDDSNIRHQIVLRALSKQKQKRLVFHVEEMLSDEKLSRNESLQQIIQETMPPHRWIPISYFTEHTQDELKYYFGSMMGRTMEQKRELQDLFVKMISQYSKRLEVSDTSTSQTERCIRRKEPFTNMTYVLDKSECERQRELGNDHFRHKRYQEAITCYMRCTELYPTDYRPYLNLSLCYLRMRDLDNARENVCRAIRYESKKAKPYARHAVILYEMGEYAYAKSQLEHALHRQPNNEELLAWREKIERRIAAKKEEENENEKERHDQDDFKDANKEEEHDEFLTQ